MYNVNIEELLKIDTPFLSMKDMQEQDWIELDFALEKFDRENCKYILNDIPVLAFVLKQIHFNKDNFLEVPTFIRNSTSFQELAVMTNPKLECILYPKLHIVNKLYIVESSGFVFHNISAFNEEESIQKAWEKLKELKFDCYSKHEEIKRNNVVKDGFNQFTSNRKVMLEEEYDKKYGYDLGGYETMITTEPVLQPVLPVLKNKEQREAFIDNYKSWPVWIQTNETGEIYYRYNLPDDTSVVVRQWVARSDWRMEEYDSTELFLLKDGKYFRDCETSKTSLIEHLKNVQKKG